MKECCDVALQTNKVGNCGERGGGVIFSERLQNSYSIPVEFNATIYKF